MSVLWQKQRKSVATEQRCLKVGNVVISKDIGGNIRRFDISVLGPFKLRFTSAAFCHPKT